MTNNQQNILITGGSGFIGKNIILSLHKRFNFVVLDKFPLDNLFLEGKKIVNYQGDVSDYKIIKNIFETHKISAVIHLVTFYRPVHRPEDISPMISTNVAGISNLIEMMLKYSIPKLINTGTCFEYKITENVRLDENSPLEPWNLYALTKIMAEEVIDFYFNRVEKGTFNPITLRLFPPFGFFDNPNKFIPYVIHQALENKPIEVSPSEQEWDYVFSLDVANAFEKALKLNSDIHEKFNICCQNAVSLKKIINYILSKTNSQSEVHFGAKSYRKNEIMYLEGNNEKARKILKWYPRFSIFDGINQYIKYIKGEDMVI